MASPILRIHNYVRLNFTQIKPEYFFSWQNLNMHFLNHQLNTMTSHWCSDLVSQVAHAILWDPGYADRKGFFLLSQMGWVILIVEIESVSYNSYTEYPKPDWIQTHMQKSHMGDGKEGMSGAVVLVFCFLVCFKMENNMLFAVRDQREQIQSHAMNSSLTRLDFLEQISPSTLQLRILKRQENFSHEPQSIITFFRQLLIPFSVLVKKIVDTALAS